MTKTTPAQRTLAMLREQGYRCEVTERWNSFARIRQDLFQFVDVLAIAPRMIAVQTTSGGNVSKRLAKIVALPSARDWVQAGHRIVIHGWAKRGPKGKRKRWTCREVEVTVEDFEMEVTK